MVPPFVLMTGSRTVDSRQVRRLALPREEIFAAICPVLGLDGAVLSGVCGLVARDGWVQVRSSVLPGENVPGLAGVDSSKAPAIALDWAAYDFELVSMRPATADDLRASRSSWGRRLGDRPAWLLTIRRCGSVHAPAREMGDTSD